MNVRPRISRTILRRILVLGVTVGTSDDNSERVAPFTNVGGVRSTDCLSVVSATDGGERRWVGASIGRLKGWVTLVVDGETLAVSGSVASAGTGGNVV